MGFPPIGIMSLSSVIKQAGHECVMFDQANPDTPNQVIIDRINREQPALVGLSFLSTTSYPYAKMLAREIRATNQKVKLAFGGVFASLNAPLVKLQCPEVDFVCRGDGEQLLLDLLANFDNPQDVASLTWMKDGQVIQNPNRAMERQLDQWPFPDRESLKLDYVESRSCFRWTGSRRCKRLVGVPGPVSSATSRSSTKASGEPAAHSMSSRR
jgi:anaerobic magnesium-protoporphyrin IX monomethyl ester cyclase